MTDLSVIAKKLKCEKQVALFCHVRPDGDTLGSALALKLSLESLGVRVDVVCEDAVPARFSFLKEFSLIMQNPTMSLNEYSALVAIDCADVTRLGDFAEQFLRHKNTFNIDHHVSNDRYAVYNYVVDNASNCENIYALIIQMGVKLNTEIANLLATGIVTDTGSFRHKNVTPFTFEVASVLKENGADFNSIIYHNFYEQTKGRAKLFGMIMSKLRYFENDRFAVATVFKEDLEKAQATASETEGFIDFIMGIDCVEVGACIMEISKNKFKVSLRSKTADVSAVASSFGGGGHVLASGCQIAGDYEDVVDRVRFAVSRELPEI